MKLGDKGIKNPRNYAFLKERREEEHSLIRAKMYAEWAENYLHSVSSVLNKDEEIYRRVSQIQDHMTDLIFALNKRMA